MTKIHDLENKQIITPVESIEEPLVEKAGVQLLLKREDLIHPFISGNKWRKLKYNLLDARKKGHQKLLTFGGAYSNHIYAVAAAGKTFGFKTIGIIRGEKPKSYNPTLQFAMENGMQLIFISRSDYRNKESFLSQLPLDLENIYILPEGGTNDLALRGCAEIVTTHEDVKSVDIWCTACGTGGTIAGIITALKPDQKALGFSVLKRDFLNNEVEKFLQNFESKNHQNWSINTKYHFGGYAKFDVHLIRFINEFKQMHRIQLDPIYTGKMMFGILDLIKKGYFSRGSTIMAVHTGGQQGIQGFNQRFGNLLE